MDYFKWVHLIESSNGFHGDVMRVLDRSFRVMVCEAIRCEEERDFERGEELSEIAHDLEAVIIQFSHDFPSVQVSEN
jgi:hypothetical protein